MKEEPLSCNSHLVGVIYVMFCEAPTDQLIFRRLVQTGGPLIFVPLSLDNKIQ